MRSIRCGVFLVLVISMISFAGSKKTPYQKIAAAIQMNKKDRVKALINNTPPEKLINPSCETPLLLALEQEDQEIYTYLLQETLFGAFEDLAQQELRYIGKEDTLARYLREAQADVKMVLHNRFIFFEPLDVLRSFHKILFLNVPGYKNIHELEKQSVKLIMKAHYFDRIIEVLEHGFLYDAHDSKLALKLLERNMGKEDVFSIVKALYFNRFSRILETALQQKYFSDVTLICTT